MKLIDILYEQKQSTQLKRLPLSYKLSGVGLKATVPEVLPAAIVIFDILA